ncbi:hypothetical protein PC129_g18924 [Phytophthora cactorum]|uniref:RxLR effector protein n=1 Tax=Phytophthora cactorum TaxID=29920 RepID=A0A329STR5_9STRA|nr:hypothetical protein Pcac1_g13835 [Phytophthora cactorum]KAG2800850.1 hypothetical protein PC112_g20293 [Phytophthora cactorum]KAG2801384.1 hypothetical protein PC111_g19562 [Phytophthora cactorum]KAG2835784.1 hypothetical protein PC113_g20150 [Phytophthora cactorum]KAG2880121.1 hypothetical protein PC114_g22232 [Phytophthora cactorum]
MKTSTSILTTMDLLAVAALSVSGVLAEQSIVTSNINTSLYTFLPSRDEKASWAPARALKVKDSPQHQGQQDDGKPKHPHQHHAKNDGKNDSKPGHHLALGQAPVATPASTATGNTNVTPAPTKPKPTPAATKAKATTAPTKPQTKAPSPKQKATPTATKSTSTPKPKVTPAATKSTPPPTKTRPKVTPAPTKPTPTAKKSTASKPTPPQSKSKEATTPAATTSTISGAVQQKTRNLRDGLPKQLYQHQRQQQSLPDQKSGLKPTPKNGNKHD